MNDNLAQGPINRQTNCAGVQYAGLLRLIRYSGQHRNQLLQAIVYSVLNRLFDIAPPVLIGAAVDVVVSKEHSFLGTLGVADTTLQLWLLVAITVFVWILESLFEYLHKLKWWNLAQSLQHNLRLDAYHHMQSLDMNYFENQSSGNLLSILNDDINQLERFLNGGANDLVQFLTTMIAVGGLYLCTVPSIAWMVLVPMPFVFWGSLYFQRALATRYAAMRESVGLMNGVLANNIAGIATIKSYVTEEHEAARIQRVSEDYRERNREVIVVSAAFIPVIRMIIVVGFSGILLGAGQMTLNGSLNVGLYSILVFMSQRLLWPLTRLGDTLDLYQRAMASTARVTQLLATQPSLQEDGSDIDRKTIAGAIEFRDVSFAYTQKQQVLNKVSFSIEAGQTVAFVGATGSGKSTLVKLLLRFYAPTDGTIYLDGKDLAKLSAKSLRRAIGYVSQDSYLFHGSVGENISYGSFASAPDDIIAAAQQAESYSFIRELPEGLDTIIGERGQKLSGGQRQRVSIARALIKQPPIFILDEATSAVDNETEAAIQRSLDGITRGRTTIIIAHRLSTIVNADMIFVLDGGAIVESGTHSDLVSLKGIYAQLWKVQTGMVTPAGS
jgi:ATP-binding cassette subfamily B protein